MDIAGIDAVKGNFADPGSTKVLSSESVELSWPIHTPLSSCRRNSRFLGVFTERREASSPVGGSEDAGCWSHHVPTYRFLRRPWI